MSITDRMENDGMSFEDAKMKESLTVGDTEGERICAAISRLSTAPINDINIVAMLKCCADYMELEDKRLAEHLAAWKANNAYHAQRIAELEEELAVAKEYPAEPRMRRALKEYAMQQRRFGESLQTKQDPYAGLINIETAEDIEKYLGT